MRARRACLVAMLCALSALARGPDYDAFSDADGHIGTPQHLLAAQKMVLTPGQAEALFADVAKGNRRAARVFQELETRFFPDMGREVARREYALKCRTPVVKEFSDDCRPHWEFLGVLPKTEAGARLLKAASIAYQAEAKQLGIEEKAIMASVNALLAVGGAAMVVHSAETRAVAATRVAAASAEKGQIIALGRNELLEDFAKTVGGKIWSEWAGSDTANWKAAFTKVVSDPSNQVKMALDEVGNPWAAVHRAASSANHAPIEWELLQIKTHPEWWDRITFYMEGRPVANPFK